MSEHSHPSAFPGKHLDEGRPIDPGSFLLGQTLQQILHNQEHIMSSLSQLTADLAAAKTELDDLKAASDADQSTDAQLVADRDTKIAAKDAQIADLQAQLADAPTAAERTALEQGIADLRAEIATIKAGIVPAGQ